MKRSISLILVMVLLIGGFVYLGHVIGGNNSDNALNLTIVVSSEFGDKSFSDSAHDGGELLAGIGVNVNYIECKNEAFKQQMMTAASSSDMVICVGWEFWEIGDVALESPDTKFIWIDNAVESPEDYPNLLNVLFAQNEGSYLVGYIAAAVSQTGTIGAVIGNEDDTSADFLAGYTQGAKQANDSTKIITACADGDYENPELGKQLALSLYDQGADVIFQIAGETGVGVFQAAKDRGCFAIGVDKDQKIELPEYDDVILCSMKKEVGQAIYTLAKRYYEDGTFEGGKIVVGDISKGYIGVGYGNSGSVQLLGKDLREEITDLKLRIANGEIKVDTTR